MVTFVVTSSCWGMVTFVVRHLVVLDVCLGWGGWGGGW